MPKVPFTALFGSLLLSAALPAQTALPLTTSNLQLNATQWSTMKVGSTLDLTGFHRVGPPDSALCDIAPQNRNVPGQGTHSWYPEVNPGNSPRASTTPVVNVGPAGPHSPFACPNGVLTIKLSNPTGTQWQAGTLNAMSPSGEGFAPQFGYFETKIRMPAPPAGLCPWASAWFVQRNSQGNRPGISGDFLEFDQFETCDVKPYADTTAVITTLHWWPATKPGAVGAIRANHAQKQMAYAKNLFDNQWHTYGTMFTPHWVIWYRDGVERGRFPVLASDMTNRTIAMLDVSHAGSITSPPSASWAMSVAYARWYQCSPAASCER